MGEKSLESFSAEDVPALLRENVDAVLVVDPDSNQYRTLIREGIFTDVLGETGNYHDLIEKLWFHFSGTQEKITEEYTVFLSTFGQFKGKYSKRLKIMLDGSDQPHVAQMTVYPIRNSSKYMFVMDELDQDVYVQEFMTDRKVNTIQNTYLFSMYVDLVRDTTSSISITEISEDTVNSQLKYSDWRMMIVNMIWPEDQEQFLRRTDPEYLKKNFTPGRTSSYDCMMQNLEGKYIWVKLIFSRARTSNPEDDYRFVFMVQNIHENSIELLSTLKKYEELALKDPLTELLNHGGIETEIYNAIDYHKKNGESVSLMMLDIDFFKNVNDQYGHSVGDGVLKKFSVLLGEAFPREGSSIGRWGGEEFVVVGWRKNGQQFFEQAEQIRKLVEDAQFADVGDKVTCSIGVTELTDEDDFHTVFDRVDRAMYTSKEKGRNTVTLL